MSEGLIIALISAISAILAALIGAFATIVAAEHKSKEEGTSRGLFATIGLVGLVASITGVIGLIIGLVASTLFVKQVVQVSVVVTATPPQSVSELPTKTSNLTTPRAPTSSTNCQETSGDFFPPLPSAPSNGCVLIIEWWIPPDTNNCGIIITTNPPNVVKNSTGTWWYVYPNRPQTHIKEFQAKSPQCKVEDLR